MPDLDVLQIPNNSTEYELRDNRIPLNLTNATLAVGADGNVLTGESYSRAGLYFNLHLYIFGTEITGYADITDALAAKLIGAPCYIDLDGAGQGHGVGFISNVRKTDDTWTIVAYDIKGAKNNSPSSFTFGIEVREREPMMVYSFSNNNTIDDAHTTTYTTWSSTKINNVFATKDDLPNTATINDVAIASFTDGAGGLPVKSLIVDITSSQSGSGDPSPSNPRAISGVSSVDTTRTGINLWGSGNVSGTRFASISVNIRAGTYNISAVVTSSDTDASNNLIGFRYADGTYIYARIGRNTRDNTSVILEQDVDQIIFYASDNNAHSVGDTFTFTDIQLQTGDTATAYEPYNGITVTTPFGQTIYGGYLNVMTGLLTVVKGIEDMGDISWTYSADNGVFYSVRNTDIKINDTDAICSSYLFDGSKNASRLATIAESLNNYEMAMFSSEGQQGNVVVKDTNYTDPTAFATATTGQKIVYTLATPIEIQLTPAQIEQLLGQNNVFCSTGDVAVKYWKID